jgi:hypothetical protein
MCSELGQCLSGWVTKVEPAVLRKGGGGGREMEGGEEERDACCPGLRRP